jgi:hypothetical protein
MPKPILALLLVSAVLLGDTQVGHAQAAATSYPWCALYLGGRATGARSCYYASREQCMETMSGIGGLCVESPYYHAPLAPPQHHAEARSRHHRHF